MMINMTDSFVELQLLLNASR